MISTVLAALATTALLTGNTGDPTTYYLVTPDAHGDQVATCLTNLGWRGIAGDGMDAIYAPTAVIRSCGGTVSGTPSTRVRSV